MRSARCCRRWKKSKEPTGFLCDLIGERTLVVVPRANRALTLKLTYTPILATLSALTDTLQVPHPLWLAVVDYATARAMKKDRDGFFPDVGASRAIEGAPGALLLQPTPDRFKNP